MINQVMSTAIANVLAQRYASQAIQDLWSERGRIVLERELWIAILKAQLRPKARCARRSHKGL